MEYQIGWVAQQIDGSFTGSIRTLTIRDQITIRPVDGSARGAATRYDVLIGSGARMGHASREEGEFTIVLRSPELAAPITAVMVEAETSGEWLLMWRHDG